MALGDQGDSKDAQLNAETIAHLSRASGESGRHRIFVVGPFATRVNFFRQQNRALNLVAALKKLEVHKCDVAVIGLGLAGMTAALALRGIGWSVTLYESETNFMPRQRDVTHRVAHPNLNFWPEAAPLNPSTNLPFLNWVAADCSSIISDLREEWIAVKDEFRDRTGSAVKRPLVATSEKVTVETLRDAEDFDYVILATGFIGDETKKPFASNGYWDSPMFKPPRVSDKPIFVSGAGDGGLLEALRLCHTEFDSGRLIIEAAQLLENGAALDRIQTGEARISAAAKTRNSSRKGYLDDDIAVTERRDLYQSVIERSVSDAFLKRLGSDLAERRPAVYLICNQLHPYRSDAAPIHKLLLAHAIQEERIEHVKARIDENGELSPGHPTIVLNRRRTILRHGADFRLDLLDHGEAENILSRQGRHIDNFDKQLWRIEDFSNSHPKEGADREAFVRAHARRATRLNHIQAGVSVSLQKGDRYFYFSLTGDRKVLQQRPLPATLFGIPLRERDLPSAESLT